MELLRKLWALDIISDLWLWFKVYLIGRLQYVSDTLPVLYGAL